MAALEKFPTDFRLERLHLPRERGLGNVQLLGRPAQTAEFGDREKRAEQVQVHELRFARRRTQRKPGARQEQMAHAKVAWQLTGLRSRQRSLRVLP